MYTQQGSFPDKAAHIEEDPHKSAAAVVAAKLVASSSSVQMLTYVLSSLASEGVISNPLSEPSSDSPFEKRPKLQSGPSSYMMPQHPHPPLPLLPHPESLHNTVTATYQMLAHQSAPPLSSPMSHSGPTIQQLPLQPLPPMPPPQAAQFMQQTKGSMTSVLYNYGIAQLPPPLPGYPMVGASVTGVPSYLLNPYQNFQGSEGGFYGHPPIPAAPPISRQ
ncbi:WAS/WASL-interacting protein family member 1-like [Macadamia integrifolia]|uniref:WAS/WASL-interacting protein family member 1-like n=1 Tax=Macadamia integrifolia TaxID=60698 RepID=UPI001C4E9094|nr:WAS/WASL-interacting protein family member 1-like [Macadamia integrifolia]